MRSQTITLGRRAGSPEIQLSGESMICLHAVQREIALVGVSLREAGGAPPREVQALGVSQIILAGTRWQTVGVKGRCAVAHLADLAGARYRSVPGKPRSGEDVFATEQDTADGVIGTADLRVERRHAGAALNIGRWVDAAAIGALQLNAVRKLGRVQNRRVVSERINPAIAIIVKIGVKATDIEGRS